MRKLLSFAAVIAATAVVACTNETPSGPRTGLQAADTANAYGLLGMPTDPALALAVGSSNLTGPGIPGAGGILGTVVPPLPADLALTDAQKAQIKALVDAFVAANKSDLDALAAIMKQAEEARRGGKTREEVKAILDQAMPIHQRLEPKMRALRAAVGALLTDAQKAWIGSHQPPAPCDPSKVVPLTDAQKAQIKTLFDAFQTANKADLDAVRAAMQAAEDARRAGKSKEDIKAILDAVKPAMDRIGAASAALRRSIEAVLTPEQKASGCVPMPGPGPMVRKP